jgi:cell division protein FtsZ
MQSDLHKFTEQLSITLAESRLSPVKIVVVGVGGAGGNAVNRMIDAGIGGVELIAANTDIQALRESRAPLKLQIGARITGGLGCGGDPELGRQSALEDTERILDLLEDADMVFVTGGLGGGTCTGAAPVIGSLAAEAGALTVAVVTTPFGFLGRKRKKYAEEAVRELKSAVDTLITIPNERLLVTLGEDALLEESFRFADDVLCQAVQGISDIITMPGIINVDFADVRAVMTGKGMAWMGTGIAEGGNRAVEAAQRAISNPLLEAPSARGAKAVLMNITGSRSSLRLREAEAAAASIEEMICLEDMFFGAVYDNTMGDRIKVTVIATGFEPIESDSSEYAVEHSHPSDYPEVALPAAEAKGMVDCLLPSFKENLDAPAYKRWRAK